ncbi:YopX family protein, partial [Enterococcus faecalis]|nr:YopX family protein [Enterococcus faecalis]
MAKIDLWGDPEQTTCDLAPYLPKYDELFDIPLIETALMQSTGLKDENGVEIFEGDIVQYRDGEYSYLGIVKRDCYQFFIDGIEPDDNYDFIDVSNTFDGTSSLEILGNI